MTKIRAIIFDLDDTLLDTSGKIKEIAFKHAVKQMIAAGMKCSEAEGIKTLKKIIAGNPSADKFAALAKKFKASDKVAKAGKQAYGSSEIDLSSIKLEAAVEETLKFLKQDYKLALISTGTPDLQFKKIDALGLKKYLDHIYINQKETKEECFLEAIEALGIKANRVMGVGDRLDIDIKASNKLGLTSVQILQGSYKDMKPRSDLEKPDYKIRSISEIPLILENIKITENKLEKGPNIVVIGGGTGLPTLLQGLKHYTYNLSAVVTITDTGRSSGKLRKDLGILPPGDIRNNLIALSDSEKLLQDLFQYRFEEGELKGHSFGNLLIAALAKITGNFENAIKETSKILNLKGGVYPSALEDTHICAELADGTILKNEQEIVVKGEKIGKTKRAKIKRMFINPEDAKANPSAIARIRDADIIVIGPGSLLTSVIPNLLIKGIKEAIVESKAKKVYVCNIVTQPGQTEGFKASDHLKTIIKYLGENIVDYIILNKQLPAKELKDAYAKESSEIVENDLNEIKKLKAKPIVEDLLESIREKKILWEKQYLLRHDSDKIAKIVINLATEHSE